MSDKAQGFLVSGATRAQVQKWLGQRRQEAFLAPGPGRGPLRLWLQARWEEAQGVAQALTAELPDTRVLGFSTSKDVLHVAVYAEGTCRASEEVALRLRTAKQLSSAHAALQRVAAAVAYEGHMPTLLRDESSRPGFLALVGAAEEGMADLDAARLAQARQHPEDAAASRFKDFFAVEEDGRARPFFEKR